MKIEKTRGRLKFDKYYQTKQSLAASQLLQSVITVKVGFRY